MIIAAIDAAHRQVLMQAYSLDPSPHRGCAGAGTATAASRSPSSRITNNRAPARRSSATSCAPASPLLIDAHHAAAHNKIIVIDSGLADCAVVTGSFNFTYAAQHRNAENALILRGNPPLCEAYFNNWRRHQLHAGARCGKLPAVPIKPFADNGIDLELTVWVDDPEQGSSNLRSDICYGIWREFKAHGVVIPYPQREVHRSATNPAESAR